MTKAWAIRQAVLQVDLRPPGINSGVLQVDPEAGVLQVDPRPSRRAVLQVDPGDQSSGVLQVDPRPTRQAVLQVDSRTPENQLESETS